jgi:peptidoglycan/xylan/chitin deacetylase (PgdA/CDA1 family)
MKTLLPLALRVVRHLSLSYTRNKYRISSLWHSSKESVARLYRAFGTKVAGGASLRSITRIPYLSPSLALIALFIISALLFSGSMKESTASIPVTTVEELFVRSASIKIHEPAPVAAVITDGGPEHVERELTYKAYNETYEPPDIDSLKELFLHRPLIDISRGLTGSTELSITFDGGEADHAREILAVLSEKGVETTFFLTGRFIRNYPEIVKDIVKAGHEVGNHTMSHPHLTDFNRTLVHTTLERITREYFLEQIESAARLFKEVTGEDMAPYWRAPYGEINSELTGWAFDAGFVHVGWTRDYKNHMTLDSLDWVDEKSSEIYYTAVEIKERILEFDNFEPGLSGGIILMHLGTRRRTEQGVSVLSELIDDIRSRGFSFVKISRIARDLLDSEQLRESSRKGI